MTESRVPSPEVLTVVQSQARTLIASFSRTAERWLTHPNSMSRFGAEMRADTYANVLMVVVIPALSEDLLDLETDPMRTAQDVKNGWEKIVKMLGKDAVPSLAEAIKGELSLHLERDLKELGIHLHLADQ